MKEKLIMLSIKLLTVGINMVSPDLKLYIKKNVGEWEEKAKATNNPFDDLLIDLIKSLLS